MGVQVYGVDFLNRLIVENIERVRELPFDVIVHMPRSGTIPAALLATYLIKPLASVDEFAQGMISLRKSHGYNPTLDRILLVDDSFRTGQQMREAINKIRQFKPDTKITTLAVFDVMPIGAERLFNPDLSLHRHSDSEFYLYPWFVWKTGKSGEMAFDMDGILCRDCRAEEDDDGEAYLNFLRTAEPKFLTDFKLGMIVTARLEKYRAETEEWLRRHGVRYKKLVMGPWANLKDRRKDDVGAWKGQIFRRAAQTKIFVESCPLQAATIHLVSDKPTWCPYGDRIFGMEKV
jgi:hypoxanthine phosphoribosyltransferase